MSQKVKKTVPVKKDKIKIKNAKALFKDINDGAKQVVVAYDKRENFPNKFKKIFKEKIYDKIASNVILGEKYEKTGKKRSTKQILKLVIYTLLAITIIAVTNITLLEKFSMSVNEYIEQTPDIKDRKILEIIKEIIQKFVQKMNELTIIQRLLTGTVFMNTIINQVPMLYKDADNAISLPFWEMLKRLFFNLVNLENRNIIKS